MKIAVNARMLIKDRLEGIGVFSHEILQRICKAHPEHSFYFFFDRTPDEEFLYGKNVFPVVLAPQARHPLLWNWWLRRVGWKVNALKPELFLSPDGFLPPHLRVPALNIIHDINFEYHPEFLPGPVLRYYRKYFPAFARNADALCTVSSYSARTLAEKYRLDVSKISVIPNAASSSFRPVPESERLNWRNKLTEGSPYFIYVGSLNPRKNIRGLIRAFDEFRSRYKESFKLVLAGEVMHGVSREKLLEGIQHSSEIVFLGRVPSDSLPGILASASALTYLPFFEGFGIPVVEAMQCGVPVLCSDRSSLPEVVGDAALLTDPSNISGISQAMQTLASDTSLRNNLAEKGKLRAAHFSWDESASLLWQKMNDLAQRK